MFYLKIIYYKIINFRNMPKVPNMPTKVPNMPKVSKCCFQNGYRRIERRVTITGFACGNARGPSEVRAGSAVYFRNHANRAHFSAGNFSPARIFQWVNFTPHVLLRG